MYKRQNTYFLFSASVPYYLVFVGMGIENGFVDGAWNVKGTLTYTGLVIALVIVAVYLLCWLLSKKLRALPPTEEPRNVCTGPEF